MEHFNWGLPVAIDLFAAGMGAAAFMVAVIADFAGREKYASVRYAGALVAPWPAIVGVLLLVVDLGNPQRFWEMLLRRGEGLSLEFPFLMFNPGSVMSWGTWILTIFVILSLLYLVVNIVTIAFPWGKIATRIAGVLGFPFALAATAYTGVLISATSNNLWNTPLLPLLFVTSALATGIAVVVVALAKLRFFGIVKDELPIGILEKLNSRIILFQLAVVALFVGIGLRFDAMRIMVGSHYGIVFWGLVVLLGLIYPVYYGMKKGEKSAFGSILASGLVLVGGLLLRYVILMSGQVV